MSSSCLVNRKILLFCSSKTVIHFLECYSCRYSCFYLHVCSLWMSFGVYVTGVLFQTASFVSFFLISHGYSITCESLSLTERRTTAALGCVFYLSLVGYRASVPYFTVSFLVEISNWHLVFLCYILNPFMQVPLLFNYLLSFYVIFHHISKNMFVLREQLTFIEDENVEAMRDAVYMKYTMFK